MEGVIEIDGQTKVKAIILTFVVDPIIDGLEGNARL